MRHLDAIGAAWARASLSTPPRSQAAHKAGADNCDGRVAEQARAIRFVRRVEARGGIKRWCAAEVFELARLRALVARHRAYAFFPPYLACSRARVYGITPSTRRGNVFGTGATIGPEAPLGTTKESQIEVLNFCATTEFVARRKHKYATLRELAAAVAAQYAVVAALFDAECLPDDAFACVASFWLGPRGYDAAPAARPRLAMPSIELESSSSSSA